MANDTPTLGDLDGDWLDTAAELQLEQVAVRSAAHMSWSGASRAQLEPDVIAPVDDVGQPPHGQWSVAPAGAGHLTPPG
jgi:hypothetical protein